MPFAIVTKQKQNFTFESHFQNCPFLLLVYSLYLNVTLVIAGCADADADSQLEAEPVHLRRAGLGLPRLAECPGAAAGAGQLRVPVNICSKYTVPNIRLIKHRGRLVMRVRVFLEKINSL